jgi:CBS domain protein/hemerythrin HHE cation binding domain-containing protein
MIHMPELELSFDTILEEHRQLRLRLDELRAFLKRPRPEPGSSKAKVWGTELAQQLQQVHDLITAHFHAEERCGALDELAHQHPWAFASILKLQEDHRHIIDQMRGILAAAMVYAEGRTPESPQLRRRTAAVLDELLQHEMREGDLIARSVAPTEREDVLEEELDWYASAPAEFALEALSVPLGSVRCPMAPTLPLGASVDQALKLILHGGSSCVVIKSGDALVGFVTEQDLLQRVCAKRADPARTPVEEVMTHEVFTLGPDEPLTHALALMDAGGFRHVLVAEGDRLLGVLTPGAVLRYLTGLLPAEKWLAPATARTPRERDGG